MSTHFTKNSEIDRKWHIVDAKDKIVGRVATEIAKVIVGKHKANYTPNIDNGDYVVVVNADKVRFTGNKWEEKKYYRHSQYSGGLKTRTATELLKVAPEEILRKAVWGMMNKSDLGRRQIMKLKIYAGTEHPHSAQNPAPMAV